MSVMTKTIQKRWYGPQHERLQKEPMLEAPEGVGSTKSIQFLHYLSAQQAYFNQKKDTDISVVFTWLLLYSCGFCCAFTGLSMKYYN